MQVYVREGERGKERKKKENNSNLLVHSSNTLNNLETKVKKLEFSPGLPAGWQEPTFLSHH